jgi:hypothetical protein
MSRISQAQAYGLIDQRDEAIHQVRDLRAGIRWGVEAIRVMHPRDPDHERSPFDYCAGCSVPHIVAVRWPCPVLAIADRLEALL